MGLTGLSGLSGLSAMAGSSESAAARAARYGLVAAYNMEEASGDRADSFGANTLTDVNTVTQAVGKVGNAAQFTAASLEYLSIADNAALSMGDVDFWLAGWFYTDLDGANTQVIFSKGSPGSAGGEYMLQKNTGDQFFFQIRRLDNVSSMHITCDSPLVDAATWYFVFAWHDAANDVLRASVNNGTIWTQALAGGVLDAANAFQVGKRGGASDYMNGRLDALCVGKSPPGGIGALATEIRTYLYNSGAGREYPLGWT